jgi:hypothetical protein
MHAPHSMQVPFILMPNWFKERQKVIGALEDPSFLDTASPHMKVRWFLLSRFTSSVTSFEKVRRKKNGMAKQTWVFCLLRLEIVSFPPLVSLACFEQQGSLSGNSRGS